MTDSSDETRSPREDELKYAVIQGLYAMAELSNMLMVDGEEFERRADSIETPVLTEEEAHRAAVFYDMAFWTKHALDTAKAKGTALHRSLFGERQEG